MTDYIERREHIRIYFEEPGMPVGEVMIDKDQGSGFMDCKIWGISMGGIRISVKGAKHLAKGDRLTLSGIRQGADHGESLVTDEISLLVGWAMEREDLGRTYVGCSFQKLSPSARAVFEDLVRLGIEQKRTG